MIRRIFDPDRKVYAVKALTTLGLEFEAGEEIDWRGFEFPQRRIEMWFRLRLISHFPGGDQSDEALAYYRGPARQAPVTTGAKLGHRTRGGKKAKVKDEVEVEPEVEEVVAEE